MRTLAFLLLTSIICYKSYGQCVLKNFNVTNSACDDRGIFFALLNFEYSGTSKKFLVTGNGKNYGYFDYASLPVKIPLKADCTTSYEFAIRDSSSSSCVLYKNIGKNCCPDLCKIRIYEPIVTECKNFLFDFNFNLKSIASGVEFDFYHNDKIIQTFSEKDLPLTIKQLKSSQINTFHTITVCAKGDKTCCDTIMMPNHCVCNITKIQADVSRCDDQKKTFDVMINFDHKSNADSFKLGGNSTNYGTFAYKDLPITLKNLEMHHNKSYEFLILDKNDAFCFGVYNLGIVDTCTYKCEFSNLKVAPLFCTDSMMTIGLGFTIKNPGVTGYSLFIDTLPPKNFNFGEKEYIIDLQKKLCGQPYQIKLQDKIKSDCKTEITFTPNVCCVEPCNISSLQISEKCNDDGLEYIELMMNHKNTSDSFVVKINNDFNQTFSYKALPVRVSASNLPTKDLNISVSDQKSKDCTSSSIYKVKCEKKPPCALKDLTVKPTACDNNKKFIATYTFKAENPRSTHFIFSINGVTQDTLPYGMTNYTSKLLNGDCMTKYHFSIADLKDSLCKATFSFADTVCCKVCQLDTPDITYLPCQNGKYDLKLNFSFKDNHSHFILKLNGNVDTIIKYADLPITLSGFERLKTYQILVTDSISKSCQLQIGPISKDCPSSVYDAHLNAKISLIDNVLKLHMGENVKNAKLELFDTSGRLHGVHTLKEFNEIDISPLTSGIYICRIYLGKAVVSRKVIKLQ